MFMTTMPVPDESSLYNPERVARDLMMPTGEPAVALLGACLLVALVFFAGAYGHAGGAKTATHAAPRPSLRSEGGPVPPPAPARSAG